MQRLLQFVGWSPVGLLHDPDEGDPELFYLCLGTQLHGIAEAEG